MGTPEFAVSSLKILVENNKNIVGVITAPDRPKGRGRKLQPSPVKEYALSQNLNILQPKNLKAEDFLQELKDLNADLQIVVAFRMLPEAVWDMPPLGTFNLHGSLLPAYRGAAPINWAIINGEKETGITTFFLRHEIDTGDIILQEKEPISERDTAGSLYERLMNKGAKLVLKTVNLIENGSVKTSPQKYDNQQPEAPKIFKETCLIDWNKPSKKVYNHIRGLSPYPGAWTELNGKKFKIFETEISDEKVEPGVVKTDNRSYVIIGTAKGSLNVKSFQMEGKKRMAPEDFFRGNKL